VKDDKSFPCSESSLRVLFASYTWTPHTDGEKVPQEIIKDQFFVGIMEIIVITATGKYFKYRKPFEDILVIVFSGCGKYGAIEHLKINVYLIMELIFFVFYREWHKMCV